MKISYVMILIFSLVLNGCGRVEKFDGTSPESLELSMQKVREQLSTDRKKTTAECDYRYHGLLRNRGHI
ncbi:TPA: hypothetical protein L9K44_001142 [Klebsiella quasipneumoniae subsp. quasipneumoniae]|nr:hypothetical protein [Klebsiella quasipneumoniae subsp. quasipneumoniae]HBU5900029.1 hypothetical protein [Klebsiella quasipneumoniae subsp. quasipneumoniae]